MTCPLCDAETSAPPIDGPRQRRFFHCPVCHLIYVHPDSLPGPEEERSRYLQHDNGLHLPGYVTFLTRAITPTLPYLTPDSRGLDFGCGPGPTLSQLLAQRGLTCADYDPFFHPELPPGPFDVIFATEVIEHLSTPAETFALLGHLLVPGGTLTLMTNPWTSLDTFPTWPYATDVTHVSFYHPETFSFIQARFGYTLLDHSDSRVWVLRKT